MGIYVNPHGMTKEEWIQKHALPVHRTVALDQYPAIRAMNYVALVYVINPGFTALAVAYNKAELSRFLHPDDNRPMMVVIVPKASLDDPTAGVSEGLDKLLDSAE